MQVTGLPRQFNGAARRDALGRWCRARNVGLSAAQAADAVGVPVGTLHGWAKQPVPMSRAPHTRRKCAWRHETIREYPCLQSSRFSAFSVVSRAGFQALSTGCRRKVIHSGLSSFRIEGEHIMSSACGTWRREFQECEDLPNDLPRISFGIDGFADLYNHRRPHGALKGRTPAEYPETIAESGDPELLH